MLRYLILLAAILIPLPTWAQHGEERISTVYIVNADGSDERALFSYPARADSLSVSPDGTRIAYAGKGPDIWIANMDGSNSTNFTSTIDVDEHNPVWSPDGTKIAYSGNLADMAGDIMVKEVASGEITNLTNSPSEEGAPSWSPDGKQLAFSSNRDGKSQLYVTASEGGPWINITNDFASGVHYLRPDWSPSGSHIAYVTRAVAGTKIGTITVPNGTRQEIAIEYPLSESVHPKWSPDGARLIFDTASNGGIKILEFATGRVTDVVLEIGLNNDPAWVPDGRIVFTSARTKAELKHDLGPDIVLTIYEEGGLSFGGRDGDVPPYQLQRTKPNGDVELIPISEEEAKRLVEEQKQRLRKSR